MHLSLITTFITTLSLAELDDERTVLFRAFWQSLEHQWVWQTLSMHSSPGGGPSMLSHSNPDGGAIPKPG